MIRMNDISDAQAVMVEYLKSLNTAPWSSYDVQYAGQNVDRTAGGDKAILYVKAPTRITGSQFLQMGGRSLFVYNMTIGLWVNEKSGGVDSLNWFESALMTMIDEPSSMYSQKFDITIGETVYEDTTLKAQGFIILDLLQANDIPMDDVEDVRREIDLRVTF